jgi:hypothetical protein
MLRRLLLGGVCAAVLTGFLPIVPGAESTAEARYYRRPVARAIARGAARVVIGARPYGYRPYGYGYGYGYGPGIGVGFY